MNEQKTVYSYLTLSITCFFVGIFLCVLCNQWIIIKFPMHDNTPLTSSFINKQPIALHYFHQDKWKIETQEHLWTESDTKNLTQLINAWLTILDEEQITPKKTTVQSILLSSSNTAYISFDHNIFCKEDSIFKKWMIMEGLFKTIRANNISIQNVQFLMHHQILNDSHLDFSLPWPICDFMQ